jgi:Predicted hydrolases or acyltransferases (alpha/beta hydrolase superfamily)
MTAVEIPRETGTIHVEVQGEGPLILCVPGMGETGAAFRHLLPGLVAAGFRVASMDLRGHGASSTTFDTHDDVAAASDVIAILDSLGADSAALVGSSMGAAAAVVAAARAPGRVSHLVLIGPFVRDRGSALTRAATRLALRLALAGPWGTAMWRHYYPSLFGERVPADHAEHVGRTLSLLRDPDRWRAFRRTTRTSHAPAEASLAGVRAPTRVVMGSEDPDFPDPQAEGRWVADTLGGDLVMVSGAGHYPMGEQPDLVVGAVPGFLGPSGQGG